MESATSFIRRRRRQHFALHPLLHKNAAVTAQNPQSPPTERQIPSTFHLQRQRRFRHDPAPPKRGNCAMDELPGEMKGIFDVKRRLS